jgi:hypothetical protein
MSEITNDAGVPGDYPIVIRTSASGLHMIINGLSQLPYSVVAKEIQSLSMQGDMAVAEYHRKRLEASKNVASEKPLENVGGVKNNPPPPSPGDVDAGSTG